MRAGLDALAFERQMGRLTAWTTRSAACGQRRVSWTEVAEAGSPTAAAVRRSARGPAMARNATRWRGGIVLRFTSMDTPRGMRASTGAATGIQGPMVRCQHQAPRQRVGRQRSGNRAGPFGGQDGRHVGRDAAGDGVGSNTNALPASTATLSR